MSNMTSSLDIQGLLRFLTQDAKIPLATALSKIKELQAASLTSSPLIAASDLASVKKIFEDEKQAKSVFNAAKRITKRKASGEDLPSPKKKRRNDDRDPAQGLSPAEQEEALALPEAVHDEDSIMSTSITTNRAPLVLAFTLILLKYTMPEQPLSSRLSLAQAVVSRNSKSKAISLGIDRGTSAEDEGWGEGQPVIKVMTSDIRVMKRWGYRVSGGSEVRNVGQQDGEGDSLRKVKSETADDEGDESESSLEPALWGLDLEALRASNGSVPGRPQSGLSNLPIHTPQSARSYLLRSFNPGPAQEGDEPQKAGQVGAGTKGSKSTVKAVEAQKRNLGLLLGALELLFESWSGTLSNDALNQRSWSWYVTVRPDVEHGVAGWGGKGIVKLSRILDLRRRGSTIKSEDDDSKTS